MRGIVNIEVNIELIEGIADLAVTAVIVIMLFLLYGKKRRPSVKVDYCKKLPDSMTPAEVNAYIHGGKCNYRGLVSEILDLARRGYVQFETIIHKQKLFKKDKRTINIKVVGTSGEDLNKYETNLLYFLEDIYDSGLGPSDFCRKNGERLEYFLKNWRDEIKNSINEKFANYFEAAPKKITAILLTISVLNALWMVVICLDKEFMLLAFIMPSILLSLWGTNILKRESQLGTDNEYLWKNFRKYLKEFSKINTEELPEIQEWEKYIVYASTFGVEKDIVKQLPKVYPQIKEEYYGSWFNYCGYMYGDSVSIEGLQSLYMVLNELNHEWKNVFTMPKSIKKESSNVNVGEDESLGMKTSDNE